MSFNHRGRSLTKVAVIGSGQIGPDIALYFAKVLSPYGVQTVVVDVADEALARGKSKLEKKVSRGVESGAFSVAQQEAMLGHVSFTSDYDQIRGAELVVEAATEDKGLKGRIFNQVTELVDDSAILASNSSHLEPEVIFTQTKHKERTAVVHYFFPAERNLMVEVVPGAATDSDVTNWLLSFFETIGKVPIKVKSRYGYALDPVFEGLFLACALLAEEGVGTTKQIDVVCREALGMTVGSFTAMNLTGGNPITAVGLDNYTNKIHAWFRTPTSLQERVASGKPWDVPKRGEDVEISDALRKQITESLRGAYFGLVGEILDAGLTNVADFDMALELGLDMRPAFRFMNDLGTGEALRLVKAYAASQTGFPVPRCIEELGAANKPFEVPVVLRQDTDGVALLTIRRPKVLNALDQGVFEELAQRFEAADADNSVRAIVVTGFGKKAFVSGADVHFLAKIQNAAQGTATSKESQACLDRIEAVSKPTLAALNGLAFGGGIELAMACNDRIAKAGLEVLAGQPEANLGIIPGAGGTQRLPRWIGLEAAAEIMRTTRVVSASAAQELGLISEQVEGDLTERGIALAIEMSEGKRPTPEITKGPLANVPDALPQVEIGHRSRKVDEILCKAILNGARSDLAAGLNIEAQCFGEVCATQDMKRGVENFLTKGPRSKAEFVHA